MSALVGVIMGSKSDWSTLSHTADMLDKLGIPYEVKVVSAHRTPDLLFQYAEEAEGRGLEVIIAGAGGAACRACARPRPLPVLGVPVQSSMLSGVDSLLSIVQMPAGVPVATLAIGKAGAVNAALLGEYPRRQAPAVPRGAEAVPRQPDRNRAGQSRPARCVRQALRR